MSGDLEIPTFLRRNNKAEQNEEPKLDETKVEPVEAPVAEATTEPQHEPVNADVSTVDAESAASPAPEPAPEPETTEEVWPDDVDIETRKEMPVDDQSKTAVIEDERADEIIEPVDDEDEIEEDDVSTEEDDETEIEDDDDHVTASAYDGEDEDEAFEAAEIPVTAETTAVVATQPRRRYPPRRLYNRWNRTAMLNASKGVPASKAKIVLRPGERWKEKLPRILWK